MSILSIKTNRRALILAGFITFWVVAALWTVNRYKPEFWKDGYSYYKDAQTFLEKNDLEAARASIRKARTRDAKTSGYLVFEGSICEKMGLPDEAAQAYIQALALAPNDPEAALGLARILLAQGKTQEAAKVLSQLAATDLDTAILERRAGILAQYGEHLRAMTDYERLLAGAPDNTGYLRGYSASAMAVKDWNNAQKTLSKLLSISPDAALSDWAREQLVIALRAVGKTAEAYALLTAAPQATNATMRAQLAMELELFSEAMPLLEQLNKTDPGNPDVANQLGTALRALGRLDEAYTLFAAFPDTGNLRPRAELALQLEKFDEAANLYLQLTRTGSAAVLDREKLAYALDRAAQNNNQAPPPVVSSSTAVAPAAPVATAAATIPDPLPGDAAAEKEYKALIASGQASEETKLRYAWLLMRAKRYPEAYELARNLPHLTERPEEMKLAANAAFLAGKYAEAAPLLESAAARQPENAVFLRNLADAYDALKQPSQAAKTLDRLLELEPKNREAQLKLAGLLARAGDKRRAEDLYQRLLNEEPENTRLVDELVTLYESQGRHAAAIAVLRKAPSSVLADPGLTFRLARLYTWIKDYPAAIRWYTRFLAATSISTAQRVQAGIALAGAYLETGDLAAAQKQLQTLRAAASTSPELLLLAARTAMESKQPQQAVTILERLASLRPLNAQETQWLAGQYRLIGNKPKALALYEKAMTAGWLTAPSSLEALGDLRFDAGQFAAALTAYQQAEKDNMAGRLALKLARAADKAGNKALAKAAYDRFLAGNPDDPDLLLETARYGINSGNYAQALGLYDKVVAQKGSKGLLLELAQANLAAKRFAMAESWAQQAVQAGEGGFKATLALVQALHLQGKISEADKLLRDNKQAIMAHPEGRQWLGYVAVARDRQLEAYDIFNDLAKTDEGDPGKMWLWRGIAATRRGDFARARESFDKARQYGASVPQTAIDQ